jgi:uncharacterized membrane protein
LEKAVRDSQIETKGIIYNKNIQTLAYADCTVAVGRSINEMKKTKNKKK